MKPVEDPQAFLWPRGHFIEAVERGLADAEAGRLTEDSKFEAELDAEFGPGRESRTKGDGIP